MITPLPLNISFSSPSWQVSKGMDKRTTIMVRNIPNKYTQTMLLQEIDSSYRGAYDFFYLPIDFKNKCNVGYAFINFMDYRRIVPFFREFNAQRWKNFNSEKVRSNVRKLQRQRNSGSMV